MQDNLNNLCFELLSKAEKESDFITKQIDSYYKENKNRENIESEFQEQIDEFRGKYANTYTMLTDDKNNKLGFDLDCSKKLEIIVNKLKNYTDSLGA